MSVQGITCMDIYRRTTFLGKVRKILELKENDRTQWVLEGNKIIVGKGDKNHA